MSELYWLADQRCPNCGEQPSSCDWCHACDTYLYCAGTVEGLEAATLCAGPEGPYLVLAVAPAPLCNRSCEHP